MLLSTLCVLAPLAVPAQDAPALEHLMTMRMGGLESFFSDSKDVGLLRALQMGDARLRELPSEIPDWDLPPGLLEMGLDMLGGPYSMTVAFGDEPMGGMPLSIFVDMRMGQGSEAGAIDATANLTAMMNDLGAPLMVPGAGELWGLDGPVPIFMGARGSDFVLRVGSQDALAQKPAAQILPAGSTTYMSGDFNYKAYMDKLMEMMDTGNGELGMLSGMMGLFDMNYDFAMGFDAERQYMTTRMPGYAPIIKSMGAAVEGGVQTDLLEAIPQDSTWAMALSFDLNGLYKFYEALLAPMDINLSEEIERELGMNVERDILSAFGSRHAMYSSDSTGGGGPMATVGIMELGDREVFLNLIGMAEQLANQFSESEAKGYLRVNKTTMGGTDTYQLLFPGMPVPMELTMAVTSEFAVFGATPQAVMVAVQQIEDPQSSLLENATFGDQLGTIDGEVAAMMFIDTPRLMNDGYGTVSLMTSALANAVRSPMDMSRDPGMVMPTLPALKKDAKGMLMMTYLSEGDYISEYRLDRSHLVNAVGAAGFVYNSPLLGLISMMSLTGAVVPEVMSSINNAEYSRAEAEISMLYSAAESYAMMNDYEYPASIEAMMQPDANGQTYLPDGWVNVDPWGEPYVMTPADPADEYSYLMIQSNTLDAYYSESPWGYGYEYDYEYEEGMYDDYEYDYEYEEEPILKEAELPDNNYTEVEEEKTPLTQPKSKD